MPDSESHLDKLRRLESEAWAAIAEAPAQSRAPLINQARGLAADIAALGGDATAEVERNGLLDFQTALAARDSGTAGSRRSKSGRDVR